MRDTITRAGDVPGSGTLTPETGCSPVGRFTWEQMLRKGGHGLSASHVGIILMAATFANADGSEVRPGVPWLMTATSCSESTVKRALTAARKTGYLWRVRRGTGGDGRPNTTDVYRLAWPHSRVGFQSKHQTGRFAKADWMNYFDPMTGEPLTWSPSSLDPEGTGSHGSSVTPERDVETVPESMSRSSSVNDSPVTRDSLPEPSTPEPSIPAAGRLEEDQDVTALWQSAYLANLKAPKPGPATTLSGYMDQRTDDKQRAVHEQEMREQGFDINGLPLGEESQTSTSSGRGRAGSAYGRG